jgi:hypothetical protein
MEKGLPWMAGGYPGAIGVSQSRALRRAEPDEWSVDIQEAQRRLRRTCHDRHDSASKLPEPEAKRFRVSLRNCSPPSAPDPALCRRNVSAICHGPERSMTPTTDSQAVSTTSLLMVRSPLTARTRVGLPPGQVFGLPAAGPPTAPPATAARNTRRYFPKVTEIRPLRNSADTSPSSDHSLTGSK